MEKQNLEGAALAAFIDTAVAAVDEGRITAARAVELIRERRATYERACADAWDTRSESGGSRAMSDEKRPGCSDCGDKLQCPSCDDTRPTAEEIYAGWQIRTPFGRMETVERVESNPYGPVNIWTKETGARAWSYYRSDKLNAISPPVTRGNPEIRVVEHTWRGGPLYVFATTDTTHNPDTGSACILALASPTYGETGWTVGHRPDPEADPVVVKCESKAKARTQIRAIARAYGKSMRVKVRVS